MSFRRHLFIGVIIQLVVTVSVAVIWRVLNAKVDPINQFLITDVALLAGMLAGILWAYPAGSPQGLTVDALIAAGLVELALDPSEFVRVRRIDGASGD